jgi:hypothetical protein
MDRGPDAMTPGVVTAAGAAPTTSRKANLSLAIGAAGLVLGFLLLFAVLTPAAIVAAVAALREIRVEPALRGRWRAWTGIGLAIAAPVLWVSAFLAFAENGTFGIF